MELLKRIADSEALREETVGNDYVWFKWVTNGDGSGFVRDPTQMGGIITGLENQRRLLSSLSSSMFGVASSDQENLARFLDAWQKKAVKVPPVILVPSVRDIVSHGEPHAELKDLDGKGLPQLLQTWQAPSAHRHREDSRRFERINEFVRKVLEEPTAVMTVPWDRGTIHVSIEDRVLPLSHLGKGVSQVVLLAAIATSYDNHLIGIEEPETNLHPVMIKKLVDYLATQTTNQYILTTHSAHLLDNPETSIIRVTYNSTQGTTVQAAPSRKERAAISQHLGYRASDLLQSNAVIWVEGPSDRIYIRHWIRMAAPSLLEGVHYSIMFYGGRLLAHLTGEEWLDMPRANVKDFISMLQINRRMVIVVDSDIKEEGAAINDTKKRIIESFQKNGGVPWVTGGREIENYVPPQVLNRAMKEVHQSTTPAYRGRRFEDSFSTIVYKRNPTLDKVKAPDKVRIAEQAIGGCDEIWDVLDLRERVSDLVRYLCEANDMDIP
ncbi:hypothetical protein Psuf_079940 [Phytohabitans suffuscus]|uniref:ATPase AAA-type core domain-containing protein n=1 Tax=Phytohabitans suffuscus TaxID=624315 RepID=A0A6F8YXW5_9ACTN|nr:AAA family ATPase [Phytohabitans suffuscus]BCB90681.1 hypothetical protein Psuf_079940 [Phytohabitans suffuscus]